MLGQMVPIRARVETLENLSGHADYGEILHLLGAFKRAPQTTFMVHGEPKAAESLKEKIIAKQGYLLDATNPYRLWFDQSCERSRVYLHSLLSQTVEQLSPGCRRATVKPESEFVEVSIQLIVPDRTLVGTQHPSLEE